MMSYQLQLNEEWKKLERQIEPLLKVMKLVWIRKNLPLNENFEDYFLRSVNIR